MPATNALKRAIEAPAPEPAIQESRYGWPTWEEFQSWVWRQDKHGVWWLCDPKEAEMVDDYGT